MKKCIYQLLTTLIFVLLITVSCISKTKEQKIAEAQNKLQHEIVNSIDERLAKFMASRLENPDSYHPIRTRFAPILSNDVLYNPYIFVAAQKLQKNIYDYHFYIAEWKKGGKDATEFLELAKCDRHYFIDPRIKDVNDYAAIIRNSYPEFAGFVIKHTCEVKSTDNEILMKNYEFVIRPNKKLELYGDSREVKKIALFLDSLFEGKITANLVE
ncbi:MAG: hypothetical protein J5565_03915 [Muribaculaceae bacterium]|nr:hypothetical protein [Muribaculaceae bacterium]